MTISYSLDVSRTRCYGFVKLLGRWKGSIYKILWHEFLIFCLGYAVISTTYRCYLNEHQKIMFEKVVIFVNTFTDMIPLSFVLGFYVSLVTGRWWNQYEAIPWPDRVCSTIHSYVHGVDERSRMIRRALGRYIILLQALTFQAVSTAVKRRFPTSQHLVAAGIMTKEEQAVYENFSFEFGKWWLPCHWFTALAIRAQKEGRIRDSILLDGLFRELLNFRTSCAIMIGYDFVSVPLVYTQVVTIATYMYSAALMVGRQYLDPAKGIPNYEVDLYIPIYTLVQFFFFVGWLKVAEQIVNPYGEDDDDFEMNWFLDRTVQIAYMTVDHLHMKHPKLRKDKFWDELEPLLPQTKHSAKWITNHHILGSAFYLNVEDAEYLPMDTLFEQDKDENIYKSDSFKKHIINSRSSFVTKVLSSKFGQSLRRKPTAKRNLSHSGGYSNPSFVAEKVNSTNRNSPLMRKKSSVRNVTRKVSPPHRNNLSSMNLSPNTKSKYKQKTDFQDVEISEFQKTAMPSADNCNESEGTFAATTGSVSTVNLNSSVSIIEKNEFELQSFASDSKIERMSSIPEEAHKTSMASDVKAATTRKISNERNDVENLVREANQVLKELSRTVSKQESRKDYAIKGYESWSSSDTCISSSDESDDDSKANMKDEKLEEISVIVEQNEPIEEMNDPNSLPSIDNTNQK